MSSIKSISDLEKLIKEEREKQKRPFNPTKNKLSPLVIDGSEVANSRNSGFPSLTHLINICEDVIQSGFFPITVVIDDSLEYLLNEEEAAKLKQMLSENYFKVNNKIIKIFEIKGSDAAINQILNFAEKNNAKILKNDLLIEFWDEKYDFLNRGTIWQVKYLIKENEIKLLLENKEDYMA